MKRFLLLTMSFSISFFVAAQGTRITYNGSGSYVYIERTDLRRYDNNKYIGLTSREIRSFIMPVDAPHGANPRDRYYDGNFFMNEETKRASRDVAGQNGTIPSSFKITSDGELVMIKDNGYPTFRSFPSYTSQKINYGDKWQAKAERTVDPLNKGVWTKMPIMVEYTYLRDEKFHDEDVYVFSAQWATRYGITYWDFGGDRDLKSATGSHKATILVSKRTGNALVVRDTVDETFFYTDGNSYTFKGTISLFTEYPPAFNREKLFPSLQRIASVSDSELKEILSKPAGSDTSSGSSGKNISSGENSKGAGKGSSEDSDASVAGANSLDSHDSVSGKNGGGKDSQIASLSPQKKTSESKTSPSKKSETKTAGSKGAGASSKGSGGTKQNLDGIKSLASESEKKTGDSKVKIESTAQGIRLTIEDLKFKPDSAELLSGESDRLDKIADVLKAAGNQMFLVEGHTAKVGYEAGEKKLSFERADSIANELKKRGVNPQQFIIKGSGSEKPIADNSTPEGKSKNRRVEITILE